MELQAEVAAVAKRGWPGRPVGERGAPGRHAELLVVPVKPRSRRDAVGALRQLEPADLRLRRAHDLTAEGDRERLATEAQPQYRHVRGDRLAQQIDLIDP